LSTRLTVGQNLACCTHGAGKAACGNNCVRLSQEDRVEKPDTSHTLAC
jgi:hypothetical protein